MTLTKKLADYPLAQILTGSRFEPHLYSLHHCYYHLDRNKAVGIDKVSWQEYREGLDDKL